MSADELIKGAKKWWGKNVNEQPAWQVPDLPEPKYKDILISLNLAYEVRRDTIVLGKPDTERSVLIRSYFWEIVSCILKPYAPYVITDMAAIHFHLGDESIPLKLEIATINSSTKIDLHGISVLVLEKKPDFFRQAAFENCVNTIKTKKNYSLTIESPESILISLRPQYFRNFPQVMSGFLKAVDFDTEKSRKLLLQKSKPVTYLRLAVLFEQIGKKNEAALFRKMLKATTHYAIPGKSQIITYTLPAAVRSPKQISDPIYITRFRDQLRVYRDRVDEHFKNLHLPHWNLKKIQSYAEKTKKYDTYHSSTIEGYRVTQEEIQMLIEGREIISTDKSREEIERKMALKGYLDAHNFVLQSIEKHFKNHNPLTEFTIREIYANLFSPTVEAGLLKKEQLIQYRNDAVFIRNSRYVPPNFLKLDDLMRCLVEEINKIENANATQAVIAHYGFVTIHPWLDGNGRVSRLLMNYILGYSGIPWVTIRIEDRDRYFKALEVAQCDENIEPFAEFMRKYFEEDFEPR